MKIISVVTILTLLTGCYTERNKVRGKVTNITLVDVFDCGSFAGITILTGASSKHHIRLKDPWFIEVGKEYIIESLFEWPSFCVLEDLTRLKVCKEGNCNEN